MKITKEINLRDFKAWSGGKCTMDDLTEDQCDYLEGQLEELYPDGMDETQLNDLLWFERDFIAGLIGYENFEELVECNK